MPVYRTKKMAVCCRPMKTDEDRFLRKYWNKYNEVLGRDEYLRNNERLRKK